jgi:hypothetical protein
VSAWKHLHGARLSLAKSAIRQRGLSKGEVIAWLVTDYNLPELHLADSVDDVIGQCNWCGTLHQNIDRFTNRA